jgi:hypothetical protein
MAIYDKLKSILPDRGAFGDTMNFRFPLAAGTHEGK